MSLYDDYLRQNRLTVGQFQRRTAQLGYRLAHYRRDPGIEIWLERETADLTGNAPTLFFSAHESMALFCEVLEGSETHENIERAFLAGFPTLATRVSDDIACSWGEFLPEADPSPRTNALLSWYRQASDWLVYQDRVIRMATGRVARGVFDLFRDEDERHLWVLQRRGEQLSLNNTRARLERLQDTEWIHDLAEHLTLARRQAGMLSEWFG